MTLYQRIYAAKDQKTAQRGWFIAGLFEYPLMAFMGALLGLFARVAFENHLLPGYESGHIDAEMGLPILLKTILPVGFLGIVLSVITSYSIHYTKLYDRNPGKAFLTWLF